MTAPRLTFTRIREGCAFVDVHLGGVEIGRVHENGGTSAWICWLGRTGVTVRCADWKRVKSPEAARDAIAAHVAGWLRLAGLAQE